MQLENYIWKWLSKSFREKVHASKALKISSVFTRSFYLIRRRFAETGGANLEVSKLLRIN